MGTARHRPCRTPVVLANHPQESGAACLSSLLAYYGKHVSMERLRIHCHIDDDGIALNDWLATAAHHGLEVESKEVPIAALHRLRTPFALCLDTLHYCIVEGFSRNKAYLNDPSRGRFTLPLDTFYELYHGKILYVAPSQEFQKGGNPVSMQQFLLTSFFRQKKALLTIFLAAFCLVFTGLAFPAFSQMFIDEMFRRQENEWRGWLIVAIGSTVFIAALVTHIQQRFLNKLTTSLSLCAVSDMCAQLLRLPYAYYQKQGLGDFLHLGNAVLTSVRFLTASQVTGNLGQSLVNIVALMTYAIVMFFYDPLVGALGIFAWLINITIFIVLRKIRARSAWSALREYYNTIVPAGNSLKSIEILKLECLEQLFFDDWAHAYEKSIQARQNISRYTTYISLAPLIVQQLTQASLLIIGGWRVIQGDMTIGMLIAMQILMTQMLSPMSQLIGFARTLQDIRVYIDFINDLIQQPDDPALAILEANSSSSKEEPLKLRGKIELRHVSFGYDEKQKPLIQNVSLSVAPGRSLAIVGPIGTGKSTLAKIMAGLLLPWQGSLLYDERPRENIPRRILANSLAFVDQNIFLFPGSIRDNLTLWNPAIDENQMTTAARDACIHDEIMARQRGYDDLLTEGGNNLSGGQRQRLEIARALLLDASIFIMDESTRSLDSLTEKQIIRNLKKRGCTCILIAHRLPIIRDCDDIIVLNHGKIVQRGTHEELALQDGLYQEIIVKQGALYEGAY